MRNTVHLLTAEDFVSFRPLVQTLLDRRPVPLPPGNGGCEGTLLVDGFWQADWKIAKAKDQAVLQIEPFVPLRAADRDAIAAEGELLLDFAVPAATVPITGREVRFTWVRSAN